jgi:REP element-mobilizing transposase RayT
MVHGTPEIRSDRYQGYRLRTGRWSAVGNAYLVTTTIREREPLLGDFWAARETVRSIRELHDSGFVKCHAFVVMPDHMHMLFTLRFGLLSTAMRTFKSSSAKRINACLDRRGAVWQRGFHDHCIRRDESLRAAARYIVANPLRAGLVRRLNDYPHWDAEWL